MELQGGETSGEEIWVGRRYGSGGELPPPTESRCRPQTDKIPSWATPPFLGERHITPFLGFLPPRCPACLTLAPRYVILPAAHSPGRHGARGSSKGEDRKHNRRPATREARLAGSHCPNRNNMPSPNSTQTRECHQPLGYRAAGAPGPGTCTAEEIPKTRAPSVTPPRPGTDNKASK